MLVIEIFLVSQFQREKNIQKMSKNQPKPPLKGKSRSGTRPTRNNLPDWFTESTTSETISSFICCDLETKPQKFDRISIVVHSLDLIGAVLLESSVLRVKILPLPGKTVTLRSANGIQPTTPTDDPVTIFDFTQKTLFLSIASGELRSSIFRRGSCPVVMFEVSSEDWKASAVLYCSYLANINQNQCMRVLLTSQDEKIVAHLNIEVIISSASSIIGSPALIPSSKPALSNGSCLVTARVTGIVGLNLSTCKNLFLRVGLRASGVAAWIDLQASVLINSVLTVNQVYALKSRWPAADILEINVVVEGVDVALVMFPIAALVDPSFLSAVSMKCNMLDPKSCLPLEAVMVLNFSTEELDLNVIEDLPVNDSHVLTNHLPEQLPLFSSRLRPSTNNEWTAVPGSPNSSKADPFNVSATNDNFIGGKIVTVPVTAASQTASTVSGVLHGCLHGYLLRKEHEVSVSVDRNLFCGEVAMMPEGIRKSSSGVASSVLAQDSSVEGDQISVGSCVIWGKEFTFNVVNSINQVRSSFSVMFEFQLLLFSSFLFSFMLVSFNFRLWRKSRMAEDF